MYEANTYEAILARMLDKIPDTLDKREGSIIYDALAPVAVELTQAYIEMDVILNESFADTASREYLIKRAAERGLIPSPATHTVAKGEFNIDVSAGDRFSCGDYNYAATEKISTGAWKLKCETAGGTPNGNLGMLIPVDYIDGLESAQLTEILIPGEDEEETEDFRARYYATLSTKSFGGNQADYIEKVNAISGVGGVKVYPIWNGGGTVKLVIINSEFGKASDTLIDTVQTIIDPIVNQGAGDGLAPIGHVVTVETVTETIIDISFSVTYQEGYSFEDIESYITTMIDSYFLELCKAWADGDGLIVRISQLESKLLNITGVLDVTGTTINEAASNLVLSTDAIPVRGTVVG
ncbi:baseplate J/gp47 family protein [Anaerocolumna sp.]|uniref:baseplate J/gp47 family protein n=1 Tax=Anaerocolumna sp. TaxID=2041569 RepID=UPI0028A937FC|nr:baseplate J/gp47 family protein [Anaerocolumna sp.]